MKFKIPLLNTNKKYDVYKVYNLPIPKPRKDGHVLVKYSIEADAFMTSRDKTKFTFLSKINITRVKIIIHDYAILKQLFIK